MKSKGNPTSEQNKVLYEGMPKDELQEILKEATASVENDLTLENAGWINYSGQTADPIIAMDRITNLKLSRLYAVKSPMGKQAIRIWTDYTFGTGMTWQAEGDKTREVLEGFWNSKANKNVLSAIGQRKSSDRLLIDGEIFFAIFPGRDGKSKIRYIDPLEITEIVTNPDDKEDVLYYIRSWSTPQGTNNKSIYKSIYNIKDTGGIDSGGSAVTSTEDALVYHVAINTITQRGNPLLLPALTWLKYHNKFLSSRIAIMLALAKFAWKSKVQGSQTAVNTIKAKTHEEEINAASHIVENMGVDTQPIKQETGAAGAYQDGRMIKLQVCAAVGVPEQYFGDISIGSLATAQTVELPMIKQFESYQSIWDDIYQEIDEVILDFNSVPKDGKNDAGKEVNLWYVDRDFPPIAPADVAGLAEAMMKIVGLFPEFADAPDVQTIALMLMGINDPQEVLEALTNTEESDPAVKLTKVLKRFKEQLKIKEIK